MNETRKASYGQILKSTALIGGTQFINILIGVVRVKALALFLGPGGVGLAGMYQAATAMVGSVSGLGIGIAGVRQIAEANATGDLEKISNTAAVLRRTSWISGLLGMALVLVFARTLAIGTFGNISYTWGVLIISITLLFDSIFAGQMALLQGLRRLKEMAKCNLLSAIIGTVTSISAVYFFREKGVVPYLVLISVFGSLVGWRFASKINVQRNGLPWNKTLREALPLLKLGSSFIVTGLIGTGLTYVIRTMVIHEFGMHSIGLFTASSNVSLLYIGIIINAMGADFYPRLTSISSNHRAMNKLINQQTEMGLLMSLPGLMATLLLAPWVMRIFYSQEFIEAADLIRWQILGMGLRLASWPLGYIFLAKGMAKTLIAIETVTGAMQILSIFACMRVWKLEGCGIGYLLFMIMITCCMSFLARKTTGFRWSRRVLLIMLVSVISVASILVIVHFCSQPLVLPLGFAVLFMGALWSIFQLNKTLGTNVFLLIRKYLVPNPSAKSDILATMTKD